jgi:lipopolysaccharide cholinephosphotransferase
MREKEANLLESSSGKSRMGKSLAIISDGISERKRAHVLATFADALTERGWEIIIITSEAQTGKDFFISQKIKRIAIVSMINKRGYREAELKRLSSELDVCAFLFWDCNTETLLKDFLCIKDSGKDVFLSFEDSVSFSLEINKLGTYNMQKQLLSKVSAVVSPFYPDEFISNLKGMPERIIYIPYLFPYIKGDLRTSEQKKDEIYVFAGCEDYELDTIFKAFKKLILKFPDTKLRLVECFNKLSSHSKKVLEASAGELGLTRNIIWQGFEPKPHKIMNSMTCAILPEKYLQFPKLLPETICRGIPTIVLKKIADCEVSYSTGYAGINEKDSEGLASELISLMDESYWRDKQNAALAVLEDQYKNRLLERWEKLLLGNIPGQIDYIDNEKALSCAIKVYDSLLKTSVMNWTNADRFNNRLLVRFAKGFKGLSEKFCHSENRIAKILKSPITFLGNFYYYLRMMNSRRILKLNDIFIPDDTKRKLQLLILKMYIELDRICKKNNLTYYLAAGSILGAVRHGGFIPWDDDMDITMPRKDYDKFLKLAKEELGEEFRIGKNAYPYTLSRLELKGTRETAPYQPNGRNIFLDIFPLDCAAPNYKKKKIHEFINKIIIAFIFTKAGRMPSFRLKNAIPIVVKLFLKLFVPHRLLLFIWTKNAKWFLSDDATHWVCLPGIYGYDGERFPKEYWGDPVIIKFEGLEIPTMNRWHDYLIAHYGDYMQPIPMAYRRLQHRIFSINLGKYELMSVGDVEKNVNDFYAAIHGKPFKT